MKPYPNKKGLRLREDSANRVEAAIIGGGEDVLVLELWEDDRSRAYVSLLMLSRYLLAQPQG